MAQVVQEVPLLAVQLGTTVPAEAQVLVPEGKLLALQVGQVVAEVVQVAQAALQAVIARSTGVV